MSGNQSGCPRLLLHTSRIGGWSSCGKPIPFRLRVCGILADRIHSLNTLLLVPTEMAQESQVATRAKQSLLGFPNSVRGQSTMKEGKKAADVEKALQHWTGSVIDPQLKPVQAKTRQLAEAALSLASSLERRCREFIRNTKYDMSGLGDSRRPRAGMALNRDSGEIVTASGEV